ncbi:hypothetical protein [Mucilaginibacter sp. FT3.2]|nr:hypothetical protein [Mucilaginibacter sp. FT3.2]
MSAQAKHWDWFNTYISDHADLHKVEGSEYYNATARLCLVANVQSVHHLG